MALKKNLIISALALIVCVAVPNMIYSNPATHTVFIDAGHGGHDNGTAHNRYVEDKINLEISNIVAKKLEKQNIKVELSRDTDEYISLAKRANMANKSNADLFISIHQNGSNSKSANGLETMYMGNNESLAKTMQQNLIKSTNANDRGHKKANLQVLRDNKLPAVLIECGFISNVNEGYKLSTVAYQEKVANGIVNGIIEYLNLDNSSTPRNSSNSTSNSRTVLNSVNVMSDRDKNSKVLGTLSQGTKVEVINEKFDWLKIKYNGQIGYVSGVYVK
ncbi:MAG: N-acetylmuramoyl-L-alanine amidase [Peptostreptococcaceae bacterium]